MENINEMIRNLENTKEIVDEELKTLDNQLIDDVINGDYDEKLYKIIKLKRISNDLDWLLNKFKVGVE
ncbi:hypothetical protein [Staphylococcus pasteuri]|uniref:hypothetical protein n=1 Tax=Staphylococcus pasteuri TaxID=45972 RepID=UPI001E5E7357|nr:hypothetical protein [Staphylococcus pasteuri]MCE3023119.1 hypothetical protein [Staphylococcus pasteuri]